jgi:uncharacterized phage-associated protein
MAANGTPLFPESIKAWSHGPVVPQVYHEYTQFGSGPIPVEPFNDDTMPWELREFLIEIYSVYGQFTASKLRDLSHSEPPWINTPQSEAISHESMKQFFKTLLVADDDTKAKPQ